MIFEPTTRAVPGPGAAPPDVVDGDGETAFDEDEFLSGLFVRPDRQLTDAGSGSRGGQLLTFDK